MQTTSPIPVFAPTTPQELDRLGWPALDVILITGDAYIDAPHIGVAVIARILMAAGFRVGVIPQPDTRNGTDIRRLGEPKLFWGVTGGCVDSMVANYTASGRRRKTDDMTPGGRNDRRPDRALLVYSHLIRRWFKQTRPIVLGGIEASLRRISHYDTWSDSVRRSVLFDAKADLLLFGMADESVVALAEMLRKGDPVHFLRGLCYISADPPSPDERWKGPDVRLPDHARVSTDKSAFARMFDLFYSNADPMIGRRLLQRQDTRFLVQNPPVPPPSPHVLDAVYALPFTRDIHPIHRQAGPVAALETIRFSLTTHRGCFGECRFCAITVHQGRQVISRSHDAIVQEAATLVHHPEFKGVIPDVGGPTANMYGMACRLAGKQGGCADKSCLIPKPCHTLAPNHQAQIDLLTALRAIPGIRAVFVASGLRYDLILADRRHGRRYLETLLRHHVSGQLKIAPEHVDDALLYRMGKPDHQSLEDFIRQFEQVNRQMPRRRFLTYYFMAAFPGCTTKEMRRLHAFAHRTLRLVPEQVQIFTPTPSTYATVMYHTGIDPFTGDTLFVEKNVREKAKQKKIVTGSSSFWQGNRNTKK